MPTISAATGLSERSIRLIWRKHGLKLHPSRAFKVSMCDDRHRQQEWLKFLRVIGQLTPEEKEIHLIADNYATHKHTKVQKWLDRHPRFHMHFTPTCSSWLNMVERFFRDLTGKRLRRGIFRDVKELIVATRKALNTR